MEIFYCDDCGKRIDGEPCRQQLAASSAERVLCQPCFAKTAQSISATKLKKPTSASGEHVSASRYARPAPPPAPRSPPAILWVGFSAGGIVIGVLLFLVLGGRGKPATPQPNTVAAVPEKQASNPAPPPAQPAPPPSAQPAKAGEPARELSPKEVYEQKLREGKITPDAPLANPGPPPAGDLLGQPSPPADDPGWKVLFNGADLAGWTIAKGDWKVQDGVVCGRSLAEAGARLDSNLAYGACEIVCQVDASDSKYSVLQLRDWKFTFRRSEKTGWRTLRVVSAGGRVQASLDGAELKPHAVGGEAAPGLIRLYIGHPYSTKFKDLRVRELK